MQAQAEFNLDEKVEIQFGNSHRSEAIHLPDLLFGKLKEESLLVTVNTNWLREKWTGFSFRSLSGTKMMIGGFEGKDASYVVIAYNRDKFDIDTFEKAMADVELQYQKISGSGQNQKLTHHIYEGEGAIVLNFGVPFSGTGSLKGNGMLDLAKFVSTTVKFCHK
jgi:hypothetical protein